MIRKNISTLLVILLVGLMGTVQADVKGRFRVKVVSKTTGEPIPGVKITLTNKESPKLKYTIETNKKGVATINGIDPVLYLAKAEKEGYQYLEGNVKLRAGIKVKEKWEMLTIEEAKKAAHDAAWNKLSQEEKNKILAKDEHNAGVKAYQANNIAEAKEHFLKAISLDPEVSPLDYLLLGEFAFNDRNADDTIKYLTKAKELDVNGDSFVDIARLLGASYMIKKDNSKARDIWSQLVAKKPEANIYYNLANIEIAEKNFDGAIKWLEACRKDFPDNGDSLSLLGDIYLQQQQFPKALEVYKAYLAVLQKDANPDPEKVKMAKDTINVLQEQMRKK